MAKKSMINRDLRRRRLVARYAEKRETLRQQMYDPSLNDEERAEAWRKFHSLPRDSSPARIRNRCRLSGRPRGYYRKFGLARNKLRKAAMRGDVPGLVKASW